MKNIKILLGAIMICSAMPLFAQKVEIPSMPEDQRPPIAAAAAEKDFLDGAKEDAKPAVGTEAALTKQVTPRPIASKALKFDPKNKRDPFLSKEEVETIEAARRAEQKRVEEEKKLLEDEARARHEALEKQRRLEEELKKYPAKAIMDKINVDGILGTEAIINGEIKGIGDTVLGAKVIKVSGDSVTFIFKGQTFKRNLPLTQ